MKLDTIIKFEILYNAKKIHTYIFLVMMVFQGIWYTIGTNSLADNNNVMLNAPAVNYQNLAMTGIILFVVAAIISAGALARDLEHKTGDVLYASIIKEKKYFLGKTIGVVLVNIAIAIGYPIGILLYPCLGTGSPEQFGPMPLGQLLHGFFLFTLPNLILLVTVSVFLVVMFRKTAAAYIGLLLVVICFIIASSVRSNSYFSQAIEILDPFGYCYVANVTEIMDVLELNTAYLPFGPTLLWNRITWGMISVLLFGIAFLKFNFKAFIAQPSNKLKYFQKSETPNVFDGNRAISILRNFNLKYDLLKLIRFAGRDLKRMFRSPIFFAIMATLFLTFLGYHFFWTSEIYLTTSHLPLTSTMTYARIPMMFVASLMLLILSGELLFKDRSAGVWQIVDAMPTPAWVFILSRCLTLAVIGFIVSSLILVSGVISQWVMGFPDMVEWGLYFRELYGSRFGWITCLHIICLAFFGGALFNSRLKGHIFSITVYTFIAMSHDFKLIEQVRLAYPFVPGIFLEKYNYSEMNGHGSLDIGVPWYAGAWTALAALFLVFTLLLWNRGVDRTWKERWVVIRQKFNGIRGVAWGTMLGCCVLFFIFFQYGIHDNLIRKGGYLTKAQKEIEAAAYEKKNGRYRQLAQPKITDLDLRLDLFPHQRKAVYEARLHLENKSKADIDTLHVDRDKKLTITSLASANSNLEKLEDDPQLRHSIYRLQNPLAPGKTMELTVKGNLAYHGFQQSDYEGDLTFNGTFLGMDLLPYFGYNRSRELDSNKKRLRQKLPLVDSRMDKIDNRFSRSNVFQSQQSDSLRWNMIVSTSADQEIISPGKILKTWKQEKRNYFHIQSEQPGLMDFRILSARLNTKEFSAANIPCYLSYDSRHVYNINVFQKAIKKGMQWLSAKLGSYPFASVRVVEKPFYNDDFVTFANVTAVSERYGWTADIRQPEDEQYIYKTITRELAKQWVGSRLKVADVQGAELLTEGIAEYFALRFMDETFGHEETVKWLNDNYKAYEKGKGKEAIEEKPLLYVDQAFYLSQSKGGLALYALAQRMGAQRFDKWLGDWITEAAQKHEFLTSADFYRDLTDAVPDNLHAFTRDWIEKRIQYRISIIRYTVKDHAIELTLSAAKKDYDPTGAKEITFSSGFEIGLQNADGRLSEIKKIKLRSGIHTYRFNSNTQPKSIILDPNYWHLIENRPK